MDKKASYLDSLAATQIIADAEVVHCWPWVREGIQTCKLGLGNLDRMIAHLRAGNGMAMDEFGMEILEDDPDRALVQLLDDERTCPAPALITELERLLERAGGQAGNSSSSLPGSTPTDPPSGRPSSGGLVQDPTRHE